jgi:hypothetical protein
VVEHGGLVRLAFDEDQLQRRFGDGEVGITRAAFGRFDPKQ